MRDILGRLTARVLSEDHGFVDFKNLLRFVLSFTGPSFRHSGEVEAGIVRLNNDRGESSLQSRVIPKSPNY